MAYPQLYPGLLIPPWPHSVLVSPCPLPSPSGLWQACLGPLPGLWTVIMHIQAPGNQGSQSAGRPAKASHTSLSQEPGFNLFLVISHELTLSRLHLEFSQLKLESGRRERSSCDQQPGRLDWTPCLGCP